MSQGGCVVSFVEKGAIELVMAARKNSLVYLRTCNEFEGNVSALLSSAM
jgi:hypothetical protein